MTTGRGVVHNAAAMPMRRESRWERVYAVVRRIPRGRVATYGDVAALAGLPGRAREVGWALHALDDESRVPWQRVVNARGEVSLRGEPAAARVQRALLEREGVRFGANGRIDLAKRRWPPGAGDRPSRAKRARKR